MMAVKAFYKYQLNTHEQHEDSSSMSFFTSSGVVSEIPASPRVRVPRKKVRVPDKGRYEYQHQVRPTIPQPIHLGTAIS